MHIKTPIQTLPASIIKQIETDLYISLTSIGIQGEELRQAIERGLNSKLCDLSDTINIKKYLK